MKLTITLSLIILIGSLFSSGMIKGNVMSIENEPMSEANLTIIGTTMGSSSNDNGNYLITNVPEGRYIIRCSYIGHSDEFARGVKVQKDSTVYIDFVMYPTEYQLQSIEVNQKKDDLNKLIYSRDLAKTESFKEQDIKDPSIDKVDLKVKVGFWVRFRHFFYKMFH